MIEAEEILKIANLGAIPMLTLAVIVLWRRYEALQREFVDYLKQSAMRGDEAAQNALQRKQ